MLSEWIQRRTKYRGADCHGSSKSLLIAGLKFVIKFKIQELPIGVIQAIHEQLG